MRDWHAAVARDQDIRQHVGREQIARQIGAEVFADQPDSIVADDIAAQIGRDLPASVFELGADCGTGCFSGRPIRRIYLCPSSLLCGGDLPSCVR